MQSAFLKIVGDCGALLAGRGKTRIELSFAELVLVACVFRVVEVGQAARELRLVEGSENDLDAHSPKYKNAPGFLSAHSLSRSSSGRVVANPDRTLLL
jgi:hypothetical protein